MLQGTAPTASARHRVPDRERTPKHHSAESSEAVPSLGSHPALQEAAVRAGGAARVGWGLWAPTASGTPWVRSHPLGNVAPGGSEAGGPGDSWRGRGGRGRGL